MRGLVVFPLLTLFLLAVFSMLGGAVPAASYSTTINGSGSSIINGSETAVDTGQGIVTFAIDPTLGFIALIATVVGIGVVAGIRAVGSGLGEVSVELIIKSAFFMGLWGLLSVLSTQFVVSIPLFGTIIYLALTFMYVIGFIMEIRGGGSAT